MSALANRRPTPVAIHATPPAEPGLPPSIAYAVAGYIEPVVGRGQFGEDDPGHYVAPAVVSHSDWLAAQVIADRFDAMLVPVTEEVLAAWLFPVNAASRNPQAPAEFAMRVAGIAEMVGDLPAAAFTGEARRKLATGFFPSHEDVRAAVGPVAEPWIRKRNALRSLRERTDPAPEKPGERTPDEIAAVQAKAAAFYAEMNAKAAVKRAESVKPMPLHPHDLLAAYDAADTPAARFRADQIRKALEA